MFVIWLVSLKVLLESLKTTLSHFWAFSKHFCNFFHFSAYFYSNFYPLFAIFEPFYESKGTGWKMIFQLKTFQIKIYLLFGPFKEDFSVVFWAQFRHLWRNFRNNRLTTIMADAKKNLILDRWVSYWAREQLD